MLSTILSKIIIKSHVILVDVKDMTKLMEILDNYKITKRGRIKFGNCGWENAKGCWYFDIYCTDSRWFKILFDLKKNKIELLPEYTGM